MPIRKIHHVAYRCRDALETARWYERHLGMKLVLSIAEDEVPSTKEADPYMHIFLDAGNGNVLAFFELPTRPAMGRDPNTPAWTQHLALEVGSMDELLAAKSRLEAGGIDVNSAWSVGPTTSIPAASSRAFAASSSSIEPTSSARCCVHAGVFGSRPIAGRVGSSKNASTLPLPASRKMCM